MRVLHLGVHDWSGAGRAMLRLHRGLLQEKLNSRVLVAHQSSDLESVAQLQGNARLYQKLQLQLSQKILSQFLQPNAQAFSVNWTPTLWLQEIRQMRSDVIHLHWIGWEFLRIEAFAKLNIPLVWTMHDMWTFTGGCHYSEDCDRHTTACGNCPQLKTHQNRDLSQWVWTRKMKAWQNLNLTLVAPSQWLGNCAQQSSIGKRFPIQVIPNGLDTRIYKPMNRQEARKRLNLPLDAKLVLFGATRATGDRRKGYHLLLPALQNLYQTGVSGVELVVFGASQPPENLHLGYPCHYLGKLADDVALALLYAAADVFVLPSLFDNLPNTVMEAIACGTPCVAFRVGGNPDLIEHQINGYLAHPYDIEDLAAGIAWILADPDRHQRLSDRSRAKAEQEFGLPQQAKRYQRLYADLITPHS